MENIYALYHEWEDQRKYFYVGRTGRDPKIRHNEHRLRSKTGSEDVYKFIRERLQPSGIDTWDMEVLYSEPNGRPEDCEDFWVVLMIRAGHDLKNMKHGDLHRVALELLARKSGEFSTVDEFVEFRERVAREDYERSLRLQREIRGETEGDPVLLELVRNVSANFREKNAANVKRQLKKEERVRQNAIEKEEWLKNLRIIKDGE